MKAFPQLILGIAALYGTGALCASELSNEGSCLNANSKDSGIDCAGAPDVLDFGRNLKILEAIDALGLKGESITFSGCANGRFSTSDISPKEDQHIFRISYPIYPDASQSSHDDQGIAELYIPPLTHELSHVFQIKYIGNVHHLTTRMPMPNVELEADFLSGIVFTRTQDAATINYYQRNLSLVGLYNDSSTDAHGTWEARVSAFRRGAFLESKVGKVEIAKADDIFQYDVYKELIENSPNEKMTTEQSPLQLDILSNCGDANKLYDALQSNLDSMRCRSAKNPTEKYVESQTATPGLDICFTNTSIDTLATFSCLKILDQDSNPAILCFKPAPNSILDEHFNDKQILQSAQYLRSVGKCGKDIDTSISLDSLYPQFLRSFSSFQFGFIRNLGDRKARNSVMSHGFGKWDNPSGGSDWALEYVYAFINRTPPLATAKSKIGAWYVQIDNGEEFSRLLGKTIFKGLNDKISFKIRSVEIERAAYEERPTSEKILLLKRINQDLQDQLETEGFQQLPESFWATPEGQDLEKNLNDLKEKSKGAISLDETSMYISSILPCASDGSGAVGALPFTTPAPADKTRSFGAATMIVVTLGNCAGLSASANKYTSRMLEQTESLILKRLDKTK
ncbi:hypothetical protein [Pseudomonas sp. NFR16]|uniref:hypothetical protein n=1 Tax=Pseudomonas sp. NFR16 TaxID=1566248 RepID=UPI0008ADC62F|nr:hypothetical protein [Pseudomonas sp. NFR16]SEJ77743.1 hypothetical protein SAMN03159495_4480 [Pseudomonas sp. NFR16]